MLPYTFIASTLEEIGFAPRNEKIGLVSDFLVSLKPTHLCAAVRLFMGELWPSWERKEMRIGPESLMQALQEISGEDVFLLREKLVEIGEVTEVALKNRNQQSLSPEPLDAFLVYEQLRRISGFSGQDSEHRKEAILRGLLLEALPLEGKYIARTVVRNMRAGLGPKTMIAAISQAFGQDESAVQRGYSLLPELGLLARAAARGETNDIKIRPLRPISAMLVRPGEAVLPGAYLPIYSGLKVQVHKSGKEIGIYTARLKDFTASLSSLHPALLDLEHDFIVDARLLGFQEEKLLGQAEMVKYINHRHLSRKSSASPSLMAYDLVYMDGEDLTALDYGERRKKLLSVFGQPNSFPFKGIAPAEERVLHDLEDVDRYYLEVQRRGGEGLMARDLHGLYHPGEKSSHDFILAKEETLNAAIVRAEYGLGKREGLLARYGMGLRKGDELVFVGWASSGLTLNEARDLSDHLQGLIQEASPERVELRPEVVLALKVSGARCEGEFRLFQPRIVDVRYDAALDEVDELDILEAFCRK